MSTLWCAHVNNMYELSIYVTGHVSCDSIHIVLSLIGGSFYDSWTKQYWCCHLNKNLIPPICIFDGEPLINFQTNYNRSNYIKLLSDFFKENGLDSTPISVTPGIEFCF